MQSPSGTPAWILVSTGLGTAIGALIALVGAAIAFRGVRLTASTTWRTAQIDRQHEALLSFYDATNNPRTASLDHAWRRLRLTGPRHLATAAEPTYRHASRLDSISISLGDWQKLLNRTQSAADEEERQCARHTAQDRPVGMCCQEVMDSYLVHEALKKFTDLDSCEPQTTQTLMARVDDFAMFIAARTDGTTGNLVTGKDIQETLDRNGHPGALRAERKQCLANLEHATEKLIAAVNAWQDRPTLRRRKEAN